MEKIKKIIKTLFIVFLGVIFSLYLITLFNPYVKILYDTDTQSFYLSFYQKILSEEKFEILLQRLLDSNDIETIESIGYFCNEKKLSSQIKKLKLKEKELNNFKNDTVWKTQIDFSYSRGSNVLFFKENQTFKNNIYELNIKCN